MSNSILKKTKLEKNESSNSKVDLKDAWQLIKSLEEKRSLYEADWVGIRDYLFPASGRSLSDNTSGNRKSYWAKVLNSISQLAIRNLATGMQSGLISPSRQWFELGLKGQTLPSAIVTKWLSLVRDIMLHLFNEADIYGAMYQLFKEMALYGQSVILIEEHLETAFQFTTLSCGDYWLDSNDDGEVDILLRKMYFSARDMARKFGKDTLPEAIIEALEKNNTLKKFEVVHIIRPRENFEHGKKDQLNMKWEDLYLFKGGNNSTDESGLHILRRGGFRYKPFVSPRWEKMSNETYGTSPAYIAMADVRTLYELDKKCYDSLAKNVAPPVTAKGNLKNSLLDLSPNGVTYVPLMNADAGVVPIHQPQVAYQMAESKLLQLEARIKEVFFNDLFAPVMNKDKNMSATEVNAINSEKMGSITPVIELLEKEALDQIFGTCFNMLLDLGDVLPPIPPELAGVELKIDYISVLAQAQKQSELNAIIQLAQNIVALAPAKPDALDWLDIDTAVQKMAAILCQTELLLPEKKVILLRKAREKLQQMQQMQQEAKDTVATMKDVGDTNTENIRRMVGA